MTYHIKKRILDLSSVINLITKIVEDQPINNKELINSKLFSPTAEEIDLEEILSNVERSFIKHGKLSIIRNNVVELIPHVKYENLKATKDFYTLYFMTLAENAYRYGIPNNYNTGERDLHLFWDEKQGEFIAYNLPRNDDPVPLMTDVKGNIGLFNTILTKTDIGSISFRKQTIESNEYFVTVLKLNQDER